jgi:hypothetical protein
VGVELTCGACVGVVQVELVKVRVKLLVLGVHLFDENGAKGGSYTGSEGETHTPHTAIRPRGNPQDPPSYPLTPHSLARLVVCVSGVPTLCGAPSGAEEDESSAETRGPALDLDPCRPPSPPPLSAAAAPPCVPSAAPKPPSLSMLRSGTGNTSSSSLALNPTGSSSWLPSTQVGRANDTSLISSTSSLDSLCPQPRHVMVLMLGGRGR